MSSSSGQSESLLSDALVHSLCLIHFRAHRAFRSPVTPAVLQTACRFGNLAGVDPNPGPPLPVVDVHTVTENVGIGSTNPRAKLT